MTYTGLMKKWNLRKGKTLIRGSFTPSSTVHSKFILLLGKVMRSAERSVWRGSEVVRDWKYCLIGKRSQSGNLAAGGLEGPK